MESALPYDPEHLERKDAIGAKALTTAAHYWQTELRKAKRKVTEWDNEVNDLGSRSAHAISSKAMADRESLLAHAKVKLEEWSGKRQAAEECCAELSERVRTSWE